MVRRVRVVRGREDSGLVGEVRKKIAAGVRRVTVTPRMGAAGVVKWRLSARTGKAASQRKARVRMERGQDIVEFGIWPGRPSHG
jgi:hypothetical protein